MSFIKKTVLTIAFCVSCELYADSISDYSIINAVREGDVLEVASLLKAKANPNAEGPLGTCVLMAAASRGHEGMLAKLLEAKANLGVGDGSAGACASSIPLFQKTNQTPSPRQKPFRANLIIHVVIPASFYSSSPSSIKTSGLYFFK